jgi:hypothetical protein
MYRAIRTPHGLERCRDIERSDPDNARVKSCGRQKLSANKQQTRPWKTKQTSAVGIHSSPLGRKISFVQDILKVNECTLKVPHDCQEDLDQGRI